MKSPQEYESAAVESLQRAVDSSGDHAQNRCIAVAQTYALLSIAASIQQIGETLAEPLPAKRDGEGGR